MDVATRPYSLNDDRTGVGHAIRAVVSIPFSGPEIEDVGMIMAHSTIPTMRNLLQTQSTRCASNTSTFISYLSSISSARRRTEFASMLLFLCVIIIIYLARYPQRISTIIHDDYVRVDFDLSWKFGPFLLLCGVIGLK